MCKTVWDWPSLIYLHFAQFFTLHIHINLAFQRSGTRQGCPLSPVLYVREVCHDCEIGIKVCNMIRYADNTGCRLSEKIEWKSKWRHKKHNWTGHILHMKGFLHDITKVNIVSKTYSTRTELLHDMMETWTLLRSVSNHICFLLLMIYNNFFIFSNCLLLCILCTVIICTVLATARCKHFLYWLIDWLIWNRTYV